MDPGTYSLKFAELQLKYLFLDQNDRVLEC